MKLEYAVKARKGDKFMGVIRPDGIAHVTLDDEVDTALFAMSHTELLWLAAKLRTIALHMEPGTGSPEARIAARYLASGKADTNA